MLTIPLIPAVLSMAIASPIVAPSLPEFAAGLPALMMQQDHTGSTVRVPRITVTTTTFILRDDRPPAPVVRPKFDDCVKIDRIEGFSVYRSNSIDLLLSDGKMLRVDLDNGCTALGVYSGFYVTPTKDQKLCAGRDTLRSRSGRLCQIKRFHKLVPAR